MRIIVQGIILLVAATATGCGQNAKEVARLDRFVGTWKGFAAKSSPGDISAQAMGVDVKQPSRGTLALTAGWGVDATLVYDAKSGKYLLSVKSDIMPDFKDLPLNFSESEGFSGESAWTADGKEYTAKATIKEKEGKSEWSVTIHQKNEKFGWVLDLGFGKEKA